MRPQVGSVSSPASSLMGVALACGAMAGVMTAPEARAASGDRAKAPIHRTPLATCDTAPGVTVRTTLRWRLFRPNPGDPLAGGSGAIWACRREPGVARHFTQLSPVLENVHRVAGDLVEFDNGGKYTYQTLVVDLSTLRYSDVAGDTAEGPERALIGSGAIVEAGFPAALLGGDDDPASGVWTTTGDPLTATAAFDAPLTRPLVATWPRLRRDNGTQRVRRTFREARTTGVTVTPLLGSNVQLEARRATKRGPAKLSMHCPAITAYGSYDGPRQTDVIGRLVPGSESEARAVAPGVVVGRFLDRPGELRLRVWEPGRRDARIRLDLPAPAAGVPPHAVAVGPGATAIAGADSITLLTRDQQTGADQIESLPFPRATDLAVTTTADGQNYQYVLYYRDASGAPQRYVFSQPE